MPSCCVDEIDTNTCTLGSAWPAGMHTGCWAQTTYKLPKHNNGSQLVACALDARLVVGMFSAREVLMHAASGVGWPCGFTSLFFFA